MAEGTTGPKIPGGYILMSRKILESGIMSKPPLYFKVWTWILMNALYKDSKTLKRGQLFTSIREIQDSMSYQVGYRKERPTKDQIWGVLEWLRNPYEAVTKPTTNTPMITTAKTTRGIVITVVKYDVYQDSNSYEADNAHDNEKVTKQLRSRQKPDTISKNVKNYKNEKKETIYREIQHLSLSVDDFDKLTAEFGEPAVNDILDQMENYAGLKKYKSAYLTARAWLKRRQEEKAGKNKSAAPEDCMIKTNYEDLVMN